MLKINGESVAVGLASIRRILRQVEKYRVTTEDGVTHREVQAVYIDFSLQIGNFGRVEYDRLWQVLLGTAEVQVEVDGQTRIGIFQNVSDEVLTEDGDGLWWDNLTVDFLGTQPLGSAGEA